MNAKLKRSKDGATLTAVQPNPFYVRLLGVPPLAMGCYIGWNVILGAFHLVYYGGTIDVWLERMVAIVLCTIFAALFMLPGVILTFASGVKVVMDQTTSTVTSREGILPGTEKTVLELESLEHIVIESKARKSSQRNSSTGSSHFTTTWVLDVQLIAKDGKSVLLGTFLDSEKPKAEAFADEIGDWLGLSVDAG